MPAFLSSARAFFDSLPTQPDPLAYLSGLPNLPDPFFEEEWIDFKGQAQNDKDAKFIWSKALSAYANMTDGLVVWGIDARPTPPRNIDAASGLRLINDPRAFESKLRDWIRDAANPPVMGVEYRSYTGPQNEGFVVAFVPQSGHKPHRAEWASKQYYFRAGDDFLVAEPSMLKLLFYPRYEPAFDIDVSLVYSKENIGRETIGKLTTSMTVLNRGTASAYDICIDSVHNAKAVLPRLPNPWLIHTTNWKVIKSGIDTLGVMAIVQLHPGNSLTFIHSSPCIVQLRNQIPKLATTRLMPTFAELTFTLDVYARCRTRAILCAVQRANFEHANTCTRKCEATGH